MPPAKPPKVIALACAPRTPEHLKAVIDSLRLETEPRYQKRVIAGAGVRTFCNWAVEDFCAAMGVSMPRGLLARQQIQWLKSPAGVAEGWLANTRKMADLFADQGLPVLVGWLNPSPGLSSHIAVLRSAGKIAQAGATNFSEGSIARGFGSRVVEFFIHV